MPRCEITLGNEMDLDRFLDHFLATFWTKLLTFLMLWFAIVFPQKPAGVKLLSQICKLFSAGVKL